MASFERAPAPEQYSKDLQAVTSRPTSAASSSDSGHPPQDGLGRTTSHISGPDVLEPPAASAQHDEGSNTMSPARKALIVAVLSGCAFLSPISSTSVLAATPEVARTYQTTGSVINATNAAYMAFMALSPLVWGPMSQVFGRRPVSHPSACLQWFPPSLDLFPAKTGYTQVTFVTIAFFFLTSLATALAPNLVSFFVFRALSALGGTACILIGPACIGYVSKPAPCLGQDVRHLIVVISRKKKK